MSDIQLDISLIKRQLHHLRSELMKVEQSGNEAAQTVELDQSSVGRLSRMDALQSQAMAKETQQRRALQKQRIESALQRIESDTFGFCIRCEEEIHAKRLEVDPTTLLCLECAKQQER
jgi:RNA polymerase-binding transcription factor